MSNSNPYTFWSKELMDSQKAFMEALNAFSGNTTSSSSQGEAPWLDAMDFWWKNISKNLVNNDSEYFLKSMEQARTFYFLGEWFSSILTEINKLNNVSEEWKDIIYKHFDTMKSDFLKKQMDINETMQGMKGAWNLLPMDTLNRTFSSASLMPGDFLQDFKSTEFQNVTDKFLSVPGVGYTREYQEQLQKGLRLWNEYQQISQEYNSTLSKVGIDALDEMRDEILGMAEKGEEINSLRQIYDLWVACNEKSYAKFVYTKEYSDLYGRMTNALLAVKRHGRNIVDEMLGALNMPTRKGMNNVQQKQQELVRKNISANQRIKSLEKEIEEIHRLITGKSKIASDKFVNKQQALKAPVKKPQKKVSKKAISSKKVVKKKISKKSATKKSKDTIVIKL